MAITEILSASAFQLNIEALVSSVMTVERRPLAGLQSDQMALSRRSATLSDLKSVLSALRSRSRRSVRAIRPSRQQPPRLPPWPQFMPFLSRNLRSQARSFQSSLPLRGPIW
jgi:hypothetical protein